MIYAILSVCVAIALLLFLHYMTQKMAEERLNEAYNNKYQRENKKARLTAEKAERIIYTSNLKDSNAELRFIGRFDSLDGIRAKDGDMALVGELEYFYMKGEWYEVVDDITYNEKILKL